MPTVTEPAVAAPPAVPALASIEAPSAREDESSPAGATEAARVEAARTPAGLPTPLRRRLGVLSAVAMLSTVLVTPGSGLSHDHGAAHFTVRISGTPSQRFIGSFTTVAPDGSETARVIEGAVPAEYSVSAASLSATLQRTASAGLLSVEVVRGGSVVCHSETSAADGLLVVTTP